MCQNKPGQQIYVLCISRRKSPLNLLFPYKLPFPANSHGMSCMSCTCCSNVSSASLNESVSEENGLLPPARALSGIPTPQDAGLWARRNQRRMLQTLDSLASYLADSNPGILLPDRIDEIQ